MSLCRSCVPRLTESVRWAKPTRFTSESLRQREVVLALRTHQSPAADAGGAVSRAPWGGHMAHPAAVSWVLPRGQLCTEQAAAKSRPHLSQVGSVVSSASLNEVNLSGRGSWLPRLLPFCLQYSWVYSFSGMYLHVFGRECHSFPSLVFSYHFCCSVAIFVFILFSGVHSMCHIYIYIYIPDFLSRATVEFCSPCLRPSFGHGRAQDTCTAINLSRDQD